MPRSLLKARVNPRRAEFERQEPRTACPMSPMQNATVGFGARPLDLNHAGHVFRRLGRHRELVHVAVLLEHPRVEVFEVGGRLGGVVVADDPLDRAEPFDAVGDVGLQIDPLERPGHNRLAE